MIVYVTDRLGACSLCPPDPFVWISISTPGDPPASVCEGSQGVLRLWFHDLETAPGEAFGKVYGPHKLFDAKMAYEVARFLATSLGAGVQTICVHCDAGVSRSGAIALWLRDTFGARVVSEHALDPNLRVRRMLDFVWQQQEQVFGGNR